MYAAHRVPIGSRDGLRCIRCMGRPERGSAARHCALVVPIVDPAHPQTRTNVGSWVTGNRVSRVVLASWSKGHAQRAACPSNAYGCPVDSTTDAHKSPLGSTCLR